MEELFTNEHDTRLQESLKHLSNYPEMLPFIGKNYFRMNPKIFILGESHYWDEWELDDINERAGDDRFMSNWYEQNSSIFSDVQKKYIRTRGNLENVEANVKFEKPLTSYYNIRKELKAHLDLFDKDKVFSNFIYFNYFQRPAIVSGGSIDNNDKDNEVAYQTLLTMTELLQPDKIIFASVKGWNAFNYLNEVKSNKIFESIIIDFVPHASCKWWNTESIKYGNKTGREKFISLLTKLQITKDS